MGIKILTLSFISTFSAQAIKVISSYIREKRLDMRRLIEPGGMPSSHSATFATLATTVAIAKGITSISFVITLWIALVVMYEAAGGRRALGEQAVILNKILSEMHNGKNVSREHLRELWGHTPIEVFAGGAMGVAIGFTLLLWRG
jgi:hypothetical protein